MTLCGSEPGDIFLLYFLKISTIKWIFEILHRKSVQNSTNDVIDLCTYTTDLLIYLRCIGKTWQQHMC